MLPQDKCQPAESASGAGRAAVYVRFDLSKAFLRSFRNSASTFALAQGVLLRNCRLDLMLGSWVKHLIVMSCPNFFHPWCSTSSASMLSSVTP